MYVFVCGFDWLIESVLPNDKIIQLIVWMSNDFGYIISIVGLGKRLESRTGEFVQLCLQTEEKEILAIIIYFCPNKFWKIESLPLMVDDRYLYS